MGRKYTAELTQQAVTVANGDVDLIKIKAPTDKCVKILSAFVGQSSDAGDAFAQMITARLLRATGTVTENAGSAITPAKHEFGDAAASSTVTGFNATVIAVGTGVLTPILDETWNAQAGWYYTPTPEEAIVLAPTVGTALSILALQIPVAIPAVGDSALTVTARITFEEIG